VGVPPAGIERAAPLSLPWTLTCWLVVCDVGARDGPGRWAGASGMAVMGVLPSRPGGAVPAGRGQKAARSWLLKASLERLLPRGYRSRTAG
jgi:hypothetical protein